ncbi:hypothetical protein AVEN_266803-1 [Araneus ventricosus]|uniref:Uncharacterized protein n=1 Tax=Araneus ventricosus TaxID=182803 RepID=A0A4Y2HD04_ARAVE|nr:hypothetical protein AVEN_266803-1 [Araneus ventricosus]
MRSLRIRKRGLASLVDIVKVMWLLGAISDDGSYHEEIHESSVSHHLERIAPDRSRFQSISLGGSLIEAPCKRHNRRLQSPRSIAPTLPPDFKKGHPALRASLPLPNFLVSAFVREPHYPFPMIVFQFSGRMVNDYYCPTARRKPLSRVRRVEERRDTDIKINRNIWQTNPLPSGEEFVFERSTRRNETSAGSIFTKGNKALSSSPKMLWNIPFP